LVRGFKKGGKFRPFRRNKSEKSLEKQRDNFDPLLVERSKGINFALQKGRLRGSKANAISNVEETFQTQLQGGIPIELAKIERKIALNEVKREFGAGGIE